MFENPTEQPGGRGFSGGSGNGDQFVVSNEFLEEFRAVEQGSALGLGGLNVGIVGLDGGAEHHLIRGIGDTGTVLWKNLNAELFQTLEKPGLGGVGAVGAADGISGLGGELGEAVHSDPANSDKMDAPHRGFLTPRPQALPSFSEFHPRSCPSVLGLWRGWAPG